MNTFSFKISKKENSARVGVITTPHGVINTPVFMPVGTRASVKTMNSDEIMDVGSEIILGNTYHLYLKPGDKAIKKMGGLHKFMNFHGPILTDSGGYQVFSLGSGSKDKELVRIMDKGIEFKSHLDGSKHLFTPEKVIDIQVNLGSDIIMPLDVCPSAEASNEEIERAVNLTSKWFLRAWKRYKKIKGKKGALFAIIQGGTVKELREKSYRELSKYPIAGYSIGGVANAGESKEKQRKALDAVLPYLPEDKPRYLMGVGLPEDILDAVERGVDMFDCVTPTRMARNGTVFTFSGKLNLNNAKYITDKSPIEKGCDCYACENYQRGYVRHLLNVGEILGIRLTTIHNLRFMMRFMEEIRSAIKESKFKEYKKEFLKKYI